MRCWRVSDSEGDIEERLYISVQLLSSSPLLPHAVQRLSIPLGSRSLINTYLWSTVDLWPTYFTNPSQVSLLVLDLLPWGVSVKEEFRRYNSLVKSESAKSTQARCLWEMICVNTLPGKSNVHTFGKKKTHFRLAVTSASIFKLYVSFLFSKQLNIKERSVVLNAGCYFWNVLKRCLHTFA